MPDKKLTDSEIVKALECCGSEQYTCEQCPYQEIKHYDHDNGFEIMPNGKQYDDWSCDRWLLIDLLDLINRLQEEKEALINGQETLQKYIANLQAENERLKPFEDKIAGFNSHIRVEDMLVFASSLEEWLEFCDNLKAEAYKEFAERLKKAKQYSVKRHENIVPVAVIDWILKELVGEDKRKYE